MYTTSAAVRKVIAAVSAVLLLAPLTPASGAAPALGLHLHPCVEGKSRVPAQCGTFGVYENRAAHAGRVLELNVVVLDAKHRSDRAIYFNPGGPGAATVPLAGYLADGLAQKELAALRDNYNILLFDNRGMSGNDDLDCNLYSDRKIYFLFDFAEPLLPKCRARLAARADLSQYNTNEAMDDLDDLRAALGYPKLVLDGDSYGTFFSLVYMRRHPDRVESAVLDGVAPPHFLILPLDDARGAQTGVDTLAAECRADRRCARLFPHFGAHFAALARRFDAGPVTVVLPKSKTHGALTLQLSKEVFADRLRQVLYESDTAAYLPYVTERAYDGDYGPLATLVDLETIGLLGFVQIPANLSYTCAEQIPFITEDAVRRMSAGTFMGDVRVRAQQRACTIWNVAPMPASFNAPVRSDAPVLMVTGTDDPASPAYLSALQLPYLPNARRMLVRNAPHGSETACGDGVKEAFVRASSARGLDVSACSGAFVRPPFATSLAGLPPD